MKRNLFLVHLLLLAPILCLSAEDAVVSHKEMARRATMALIESRKVRSPELNDGTLMIFEGRYVEFEEISRRYEKNANENVIYESPLVRLYDLLGSSNIPGKRANPELFEEMLDAWVEMRPSYMSYAARGVFKVRLGFGYRGSDTVRETPEANFAKMRTIFAEARGDLSKSLNDNRKFPIAYMQLLSIAQASGDAVEAKRLVELAEKEMPSNYYVRAQYLQTLHPRWGGSYQAMERYALGLEKAALINPRLWSLNGEAHAERGYSAALDKDYQLAIAHYSRALAYGDRLSFLYWRGRSYMELQKHSEALADFRRHREIGGKTSEVDGYITRLSK